MTTHHQASVTATACAKAVLLGEHAVVYGFPAIAVALPSLQVRITLPVLEKQSAHHDSSWRNEWRVWVQEKQTQLAPAQTELLTEALSLCLQEVGCKLPWITPYPIDIHSDIPVGSGLGGSAALSVALSRAVFQWFHQPYTPQQLWNLSNRLDSLFHGGQASGIDTAAIVFGGIVAFQKGQIPRNLTPKTPFWLVCIDSGQTKSTAGMVQHLAQRIKIEPGAAECLRTLGARTQKAIAHFDQLDTMELANFIVCAHHDLCSLGLSCQALDAVIATLMHSEHPPLGCKLTGAGGGGFVIALFDDEPMHIKGLFPGKAVYVTKII